jgi:hypothetical protein
VRCGASGKVRQHRLGLESESLTSSCYASRAETARPPMVESRRSACPLNRCSLALSSLNGCRQFRRTDLFLTERSRDSSRYAVPAIRPMAASWSRGSRLPWERVSGLRWRVSASLRRHHRLGPVSPQAFRDAMSQGLSMFIARSAGDSQSTD